MGNTILFIVDNDDNIGAGLIKEAVLLSPKSKSANYVCFQSAGYA